MDLVTGKETEEAYTSFEIPNATAMKEKKQTETAFANRGRLANISFATA